jgi:hypothetical protein
MQKGALMADKKSSGKSVTQTFKQKAPKKNSVLFENNSRDALFQNVYLMRDGAKDALGIDNLDSVKEFEMTVTVKE